MQFEMFKGATLAGVAHTATGGKPVARDLRKTQNAAGKLVSVPRAAQPLPMRDTGEAFQGPIDARIGSAKVTRLKAGAAENADYLTRKSGAAIGMMEGWREITETPDRHRVGLMQIAVQTWAGK